MRLFRMTTPPIVRPKVTPDPDRAAELARRRVELEYRPEVGFLLEQRVPRKCAAR